MGKPGKGGERRTFFGVSTGTEEDPAKLSEALSSAAEAAIEAGLVSKERSAWFDVVSVEVELANQHPRTMVVGVAQQEPPPG
jgi:hypothetical protein